MLLSNDHGRLLSPLGSKITLGLLLSVAVLVPLLNLAVPPGSFFHVPTYLVSLSASISALPCWRSPSTLSGATAES